MSGHDQPNELDAPGDGGAASSVTRTGRVADFCATDPHNATESDVERGEALLQEVVGVSEWDEAMAVALTLSSIYLELRGGDLADNVERAIELHRAILSSNPTFEQRVAVAVESANAVVRHPDPTRDDYDQVLAELEAIRSHLDPTGDPHLLAHVLSAEARALEKRPFGDLNDAHARALILRRRAVAILDEVGTSDTQFLGRCLHNLGVCEMNQQTGVRTDHVDRAVTALRRALGFRSPETNPVGRIHTLRALHIAYPEWVGTELPLDGEELADGVRAEADALEAALTSAGRGAQSWAAFTGQRSALHIDLDGVLVDRDVADGLLRTAISRHREALAAHPIDSMPNDWAEWAAGLAKLLAARFRGWGDSAGMEEAFELFDQALAVLDPDVHPSLYRDVSVALGTAAHAYEDWPRSLSAHRAALLISDELAFRHDRPDSLSIELALTRTCAPFAAYAAARIGELSTAIELAEHGRCRSLADVLWSVDVELESADLDIRESLATSRQNVLELEDRLRQVADPLDVVRGRLADHLGLRAENVQMRQLDRAWAERESAAEARRGLVDQLVIARSELEESLEVALDSIEHHPAKVLAFDAIGEIAARLDYPLVYLVPTMYNTLALVLEPDGVVTSIGIDWLTSDMTSSLLYGDENAGGYLAGLQGDDTALEAAVERALEMADSLLDGVGEVIAELGHRSAALIPLGSIGQLPMHAGGDGRVVFRIAPSARILDIGLRSREVAEPRRPALLGLSAPERDDLEALPWSAHETDLCIGLFRRQGFAAERLLDADTTTVLRRCAGVTHLHVACHAEYRPSDPMASVIFINDGPGLSLAEISDRRADFSGLELAVLSACRTAALDTTNSDDAFGFPAQLLAAGVQGVVAAAWPVADDVAAFFSFRFYSELLGGGDPAAAAASARRWLRGATQRDLYRAADVMLDPTIGLDERTRAELRDDLVAALEQVDDEHPFGHPVDWAAFGYWGL